MRTVNDSVPYVRREFDVAVDDALLHYAVALDRGLRDALNLRVIEHFRRAVRITIRFAILFIIVERMAAATSRGQLTTRHVDDSTAKWGHLR